jgi:hypothetical protein
MLSAAADFSTVAHSPNRNVVEPFGRHNPNASTCMVNKALRLTKSTPITSPLLPLLTPAQHQMSAIDAQTTLLIGRQDYFWAQVARSLMTPPGGASEPSERPKASVQQRGLLVGVR